MNNNPLVSITIPTYNSSKFLPLCLEAIQKQSYKNIEINIVDGGSKDKTIKIARENKITIYTDKKSLLSARRLGVLKSKGRYILLLDSDQILNKNAIKKAVVYLEKNKINMLILGESVYSDRTILEKLYKLDKILVHEVRDINPYTSVMLPRFYKRDFLLKVFLKIPKQVISDARPQDHSIIYLESWKIDNRVGIMGELIKHIEPDSLISFFKKFHRWGYYSVFEKPSIYQEFFNKRTERFRNGLLKKGMMKASLASIILLILKAIPYKTGFYSAKLKGSVNRRFMFRELD